MIRQVTNIRSIGKFKDYSSSEISFKKYTAIYSGNAMGKSTITTILRSLTENNPKLIEGRTRLGDVEKPYFKLNAGNEFLEFKDNAWTKAHPGIEIFDSYFIDKNVYSGNQVGVNHRKELYKFIIGEEAVTLNARVVELTGQISDVTSQIRENVAELNKHIGKEIKPKDFVPLPKVENVDDKIKAKAKGIVALSEIDSISNMKTLGLLKLPDVKMEMLDEIVNKSFEDVSKAAEEETKKHIEKHLDENGESWIKAGIDYLGENDDCPLCGNDTKSSDLISSFKSYFDDEYNSFKDRLQTTNDTFVKKFDDATIVSVDKVLESNIQTCKSWERYIKITFNKDNDGNEKQILKTEACKKSYIEFQTVIKGILAGKLRSPLDPIENLEAFNGAKKTYSELLTKASQYSKAVEAQNAVLDHYKGNLEAGDIKTEKESLSKLKASKIRYSDEVDKICKEYSSLNKKKNTLNDEKTVAQKKLDEKTEEIPKIYQDKINSYLERFGADFRIGGQKKVNPSGEPATEYYLLINNIKIPLGNADTPDDVTSFKNTVSSGDKSTLALAIFLSKLQSDKNLKEKIIVFDDPISSLDNSRRNYTQIFLNHFGKNAKQLIVLSHDNKFLVDLLARINRDKFVVLQIKQEDNNNHLVKSSLDELQISDRSGHLEVLNSFVLNQKSDPKDVVMSIRPLVEDFLDEECPHSFTSRENMLGTKIQKIENSVEGECLFKLKSLEPDLNALNDFTKKCHHIIKEKTGPIDVAQLLAHCKVTLGLLGILEGTKRTH